MKAKETLKRFELERNPFYPNEMRWGRNALIDLIEYAQSQLPKEGEEVSDKEIGIAANEYLESINSETFAPIVDFAAGVKWMQERTTLSLPTEEELDLIEHIVVSDGIASQKYSGNREVHKEAFRDAAKMFKEYVLNMLKKK